VQQYKSSKWYPWACVKRRVFNPALNCPRLMDDDRSCGESTFRTFHVTELNTSTELLLLIFCISQCNLLTHLGAVGNMTWHRVANSLPSPCTLYLAFGVSCPLSAEAVRKFGPLHIPIATKIYENLFVALANCKRVDSSTLCNYEGCIRCVPKMEYLICILAFPQKVEWSLFLFSTCWA